MFASWATQKDSHARHYWAVVHTLKLNWLLAVQRSERASERARESENRKVALSLDRRANASLVGRGGKARDTNVIRETARFAIAGSTERLPSNQATVPRARLVADLIAGWWGCAICADVLTWLDAQVSENSVEEWRQMVRGRGVAAARADSYCRGNGHPTVHYSLA